ncbi:hypothetical protein [Desulfotignum balticum]|uniref:hypothetical protein n=1 Tax=Desulfotignum balticum TaxID=115781 RepID=UPI000462D87D|nr:hypothetical protein [Desulfotignum balticum]
MHSVHDQIRAHIYELAGLATIRVAPLDELKKTEWSVRFETLMRNRLIMGAIRYGRLKQKGKAAYNRLDSIRQRLDMYNETGNAEHLVDIANLCLLEFEEPNHKHYHFKATDDGVHTKQI